MAASRPSVRDWTTGSRRTLQYKAGPIRLHSRRLSVKIWPSRRHHPGLQGKPAIMIPPSMIPILPNCLTRASMSLMKQALHYFHVLKIDKQVTRPSSSCLHCGEYSIKRPPVVESLHPMYRSRDISLVVPDASNLVSAPTHKQHSIHLSVNATSCFFVRTQLNASSHPFPDRTKPLILHALSGNNLSQAFPLSLLQSGKTLGTSFRHV